MRKIAVVAGAEFAHAIRSKAFIISVLLMPVLMGGSILIQRLAQKHADTSDRRFAVLDHTGALAAPLTARAEERNRLIGRVTSRFVPEVVVADGRSLDELRVELSDRVRRKQLFAFVEIPADALADGADARLRYHSNNPTYEDLRLWLDVTINDLIRHRRFADAGVDAALVQRLERRVASEHLGLWTRAPDGTVRQAEKVDRVRTFAVPIALMMIVFMVVMTGAPQLLNSVIEEKMSRISEVMLGSISPFEFMMGKLVGSAGTSLLLATIYVGGGVAALGATGHVDALPRALLPWFVLYTVLAVFLYGSLYIAVGAACTDLKDAQSMMVPVMLLSILPMFVMEAVVKAPTSGLAVGASLFPPATPFLMLLRQSLHPPPALWQVVAGVPLTLATTVACVWAAGRIFRIGVLMQGKSANYREMLRWVFTRG